MEVEKCAKYFIRCEVFSSPTYSKLLLLLYFRLNNTINDITLSARRLLKWFYHNLS